jgi:hypothetical protein
LNFRRFVFRLLTLRFLALHFLRLHRNGGYTNDTYSSNPEQSETCLHELPFSTISKAQLPVMQTGLTYLHYSLKEPTGHPKSQDSTKTAVCRTPCIHSRAGRLSFRSCKPTETKALYSLGASRDDQPQRRGRGEDVRRLHRRKCTRRGDFRFTSASLHPGMACLYSANRRGALSETVGDTGPAARHARSAQRLSVRREMQLRVRELPDGKPSPHGAGQR